MTSTATSEAPNTLHNMNHKTSKIPPPSDIELAYLAGIIDGEGHVKVDKRSRGLVLCMADLPILDWVQEHFPAMYSGRWINDRNKNARPRRIWEMSRTADLLYLLPLLLPFLVLKREETEILLQIVELSNEKRVGVPGTGRRGSMYPQEWHERRETLRQAKMAATAARKVPD